MKKPSKTELLAMLLDAVNEVEDLATSSGRLVEYGPWIDEMRKVVGERENDDDE